MALTVLQTNLASLTLSVFITLFIQLYLKPFLEKKIKNKKVYLNLLLILLFSIPLIIAVLSFVGIFYNKPLYDAMNFVESGAYSVTRASNNTTSYGKITP